MSRSPPGAATSHNQQFLLQLDSPELTRRALKKRHSTSYVYPKGTGTVCQWATVFTLVDNQLYADGQLVTTSNGVPYQTLVGSSCEGNITDGFYLANGRLEWHNSIFSGGAASFCLSTSNTVVAVFDSTNIPARCIPVDLVPETCKLRSPTVEELC